MKTILNTAIGVLASFAITGCQCHTRQEPAAEPRAMMGEYRNELRTDDLAMANVYFEYDRSDLTSESMTTLQRNADWLRTNSSVDVRISGNADERGTNQYNVRLGTRRAAAAATYLGSLGIASERISTISNGEEKPIDSDHNEFAWAKNRRVELKAMGQAARSSE